MFYGASLAGEMRDPGLVTVLNEFIGETRDVSLVWPHRKFILQGCEK